VGFYSSDLNTPILGYQKQSQFAMGGLLGYDFGRWSCRAGSRAMFTREIMVGTIFAGGCASCFHLTAYSVRGPPRPSLEGSEVIFESGAGIRILQCRQSLTARRRTIERGICLPLRCNGFR
jgi:hypothetical protein